MRPRVLVCVAMLLTVASAAVSLWLGTRPGIARLEEAIGYQVNPGNELGGLAWALTGAVLAWLRPRNVLGWLLLGVGACQVLSVLLAVYGGYGVVVADPSWPFAGWSAWLGSGIWLPGLLPLASLLLAFYPRGRLPGPRWRWPVVAASTGIVLATLAALVDPAMYDDIAPGPSPLSAPGLAGVLFIGAAVTLVPGTVAIWVMSAVRLTRSRPPERQQLAWLFFIVVPFFVLIFVSPLPAELSKGLGLLIPVAIAVGVFGYNLLGIEAVLRRGLLYGTLTALVVSVYLAVTAVAGSRLDRGPLPGVVAAALVTVGLTPTRERLQRAVDRLVYGERRDPLGAVTRLGDRVAAAAEPDLLPAVLAIVTTAVRAPGAAIAPDGTPISTIGCPAEGPVFPLRVGGVEVGTLQVAARTPGEEFTAGDRRLLGALVPQVAVVVRALDLAEALEAERDRVLAATRTERDRLRRDLHDGLGPSLSGVRLGLRALHDALATDDRPSAAGLLDRIRAEVDATVGEVRRIIDGLRPAVLDETGLAGALRRHTDTVSAGIRVDLALADLPPLPPEVETAAYRIAREALTNVIRHAAAGHAWIAVAVADGALTVEVADDGAGIARPGDDGVGLTSMRDQAEAIGGTLAVASAGAGTTVVAILPLRGSRR